jgi:hypothetical protein
MQPASRGRIAFANMFFINGGYGAANGRDGAHVLRGRATCRRRRSK